MGILLLLISIAIFGVRISKQIETKQNLTGYLKRASDANTIDMAKRELSIAIAYLESNNLTEGYTSVLWKTPDEDIGFWYANLKASLLELENLESESALEKATVLIKLRETLLDTGERTRVTVPEGLSVFPHNALWAVLVIIAAIAGFVGFFLLIPTTDGAKSVGKKMHTDGVS